MWRSVLTASQKQVAGGCKKWTVHGSSTIALRSYYYRPMVHKRQPREPKPTAEELGLDLPQNLKLADPSLLVNWKEDEEKAPPPSIAQTMMEHIKAPPSLEVALFKFDKSSTQLGKVVLHPKIFTEPLRLDIISEIIRWHRAKTRLGTAKVKKYSEISGSTKKPFRQKGTGHARQGFKRAAGRKGGAKTHGPKGLEKKYDYKLNHKLVQKGMAIALAQRLREGNLVIVDRMAFGLAESTTPNRSLQKLLRSLVSLDGPAENATADATVEGDQEKGEEGEEVEGEEIAMAGHRTRNVIDHLLSISDAVAAATPTPTPVGTDEEGNGSTIEGEGKGKGTGTEGEDWFGDYPQPILLVDVPPPELPRPTIERRHTEGQPPPTGRAGGTWRGGFDVRYYLSRSYLQAAIKSLGLLPQADNTSASSSSASSSGGGGVGGGELSLLKRFYVGSNNLELAVRNVPSVTFASSKDVTTYDLVKSKKVVITVGALNHLTHRLLPTGVQGKHQRPLLLGELGEPNSDGEPASVAAVCEHYNYSTTVAEGSSGNSSSSGVGDGGVSGGGDGERGEVLVCAKAATKAAATA